MNASRVTRAPSALAGRRALPAALGLALAVGSGAAVAEELTPSWVTRLPVGAALSAGLAGMVVDEAGVAYVTGTAGPSSDTDITTAAVAPDGSVLWSHTFDGPESWHDQARGLTLGSDGILYVTGNTPAPSHHANVLLLRYDAATGALLSALQHPAAPGIAEHGASVATHGAGKVFIGGGTVGDGGDALLLAFDADDQLLWRRVWDGPALAPYSQDSAREVLLDPAGDVVVMIHGVMSSLHPDYVVLKLSPTDGAIIWEATWGVAGGDFVTDMEIDELGDVYVTGTGIDFNDKYSTIKLLGIDGTLIWQAYDAAGIDDYAAALALDGAGGVLVTGSVDHDGDESNFNDNIYTVKRDATTATLLWTHEYGETCIGCFDIPSDVMADGAGHVFVAGSTSSPPYGADVILMVLDTASGLESDRGIVSGGVTESAGSGVLAFDGGENLYDGGGYYDFNSGALDMSVTRWPGTDEDETVVLFADDFEAGDTAAWSALLQ